MGSNTFLNCIFELLYPPISDTFWGFFLLGVLTPKQMVPVTLFFFLLNIQNKNQQQPLSSLSTITMAHLSKNGVKVFLNLKNFKSDAYTAAEAFPGFSCVYH